MFYELAYDLWALTGGAYKWQNVKYVVKVWLLVLKSATHTEDQTELGKLM